MIKKNLFLVRGIPGSGKTTFAESICPTVISADDYFIGADGLYYFNPEKLKAAHSMCQARAEMHMEMGEHGSNIAIANTFTQLWEMQPYIDLAEKYGYIVHTIIIENRHGGENVHGVPEVAINRMRDRFEVQL